jgi:hypothetical protein
MQLSDIFLGLGEETFLQLMRSVSMGRLRTYQLFDRIKTRLHLHKLSSETLRKASPRLYERLKEHDEDYATDLAQAILVSHLEMIKAVLDHLGVPHEDGFFQKDADVSGYLKEGWQPEVWAKFQSTFSPAALLFYINHLAWEIAKAETVFSPHDLAATEPRP